MNNDFNEAILHSLSNQAAYQENTLLAPQIIKNDAHTTIWEYLRYELQHCQHFTWVVAFITPDMLVPLKVILADLAQQHVHGELITGTYLQFNQPAVFAELLKIPNLTVRIATVAGFHVKGYFFDHGTYQTALVGSANFTRNALLKNCEWLLRISSLKDGALFQQCQQAVAELKNHSQLLTSQWLQQYRQHYQPVKFTPTKATTTPTQPIVPNQMQQAALASLQQLWQQGAQRALVVSATGTGKTYLGAFSVQAFQPHKFLFIVHREQILEKALTSFHQVIGGPLSDFGILSGHHHQIAARYVFATIQTLSQESVLHHLAPQTFDYILIDEAHRAAAPSYQKVMHYLQPRFWLGMTATPQRMDQADVYQIFDHHVAYEISLKDALTMQMLCPFHYVGLQDYEYQGKLIDDKTPLRHLVATQRIDYVLQQLAYYGYSGTKVRGLIFCSRQDEARELARILTAKHHPAQALTNQDSIASRDAAIAKLTNGQLEYLVTVDIFNEGIDIPSLNQIVMLRNTQSSIVFTQQLGRGLRKYPHKDFVTIIDFIGNYKNNYLIPMALNDDHSSDRQQVKAEMRVPSILGLATINFSQVAQQRILQALDKVKLNSLAFLRQAYLDLKQQLGRVPLLFDFVQNNSVKPTVLISNKITNYAQFLIKMGEKIMLPAYAQQVLSFLSQELLNGKRPHELLLLQQLLHQDVVSDAALQHLYQQQQVYYDQALFASLQQVLSLHFFDVKAGKTLKSQQYGGQPLVIHDEKGWHLHNDVRQLLANEQVFNTLYQDAIKTGLTLTKQYQGMQQFTLYQHYTRKDVCRLLNWPKDVSAPLYGYRVADDVCPIFVTYHKDEKRKNAHYHNDFSNSNTFRWYTRTPRYLTSDEVQRLLAGVDIGKPQVRIEIFMKRSDAAGSEFTYLGEGKIIAASVREETIMNARGKEQTTVGMDIQLQHVLPLQQYQLLFAED